MLRLLILFGFFYCNSVSFVVPNSDDSKKCYEIELENCFREAFLSAIHPPLLHKRETASTSHQLHNNSVFSLGQRNEKKKQIRQIQICHDVKKFSSCFIFPGCSDYQAANIASVQYHMVFGKKLPMNVFLAYRGYGRELCDQQCSKEVLLHCTNRLTQEEQQEEHGYILEISSIIGHISPNRDISVACTRFNKVLINLIRLRRAQCGDIARCTCKDGVVQQGVDGCNSGCEHLLHVNMDEITINNHYSHFISLLSNFFMFYAVYICYLFCI